MTTCLFLLLNNIVLMKLYRYYSLTLAKNHALLLEVVVRVLLREDLVSNRLTLTDPVMINI